MHVTFLQLHDAEVSPDAIVHMYSELDIGSCRLHMSRRSYPLPLGLAQVHGAFLGMGGGPASTAHLQDFYELAPHKFQNKTNGVTPRRWLAWCNPGLAALITETLGTDTWPNDLNLLTGLRKHADDKEFQKKWRAIKHENKAKLAAKIKVRPPTLLPCIQSLSQRNVTTALSTGCRVLLEILTGRWSSCRRRSKEEPPCPRLQGLVACEVAFRFPQGADAWRDA